MFYPVVNLNENEKLAYKLGRHNDWRSMPVNFPVITVMSQSFAAFVVNAGSLLVFVQFSGIAEWFMK